MHATRIAPEDGADIQPVLRHRYDKPSKPTDYAPEQVGTRCEPHTANPSKLVTEEREAGGDGATLKNGSSFLAPKFCVVCRAARAHAEFQMADDCGGASVKSLDSSLPWPAAPAPLASVTNRREH
jgi:hypothetical protein